jgi:hypothetical protein
MPQAPPWIATLQGISRQIHKIAAAETMQISAVTSAAMETEGIQIETEPRDLLGNPHKGKAIRQQNVHQRLMSIMNRPESRIPNQRMKPLMEVDIFMSKSMQNSRARCVMTGITLRMGHARQEPAEAVVLKEAAEVMVAHSTVAELPQEEETGAVIPAEVLGEPIPTDTRENMNTT